MRQDGRIRFEQFSFPILPGLVYAKDGNQRIGELLFIDDSRERFRIYFESGMSCLDMQVWERDPEGVYCQAHNLGNTILHLCCPVSGRGKQSGVGYFHAELTAPDGGVYILPGQISLSRPSRQLDGMRCITALCELMDGLRVDPIPDEKLAGA